VSFRLRVLVLVMLVAVTATAATAWLTLRQASQQLTASVTASQQDITDITNQLRQYGAEHGTWEGVPSVVEGLSQRTGQRIQLVTELGQVIADSDQLSGHNARPVRSPPTLVNPRPQLKLPPPVTGKYVDAVPKVISTYRTGVLFAACLTRLGVEVRTVEGPLGIPTFDVSPVSEAASRVEVASCRDRSISNIPEFKADLSAAAECAKVANFPAGQAANPKTGLIVPPTPTVLPANPAAGATDNPNATETTSMESCLQLTFTERIADFAPIPLQVYLGARDASKALSPGPVLAAAALVATFALAGTILLSRRVLRPIGTLTSASQRLGAGDLAERVPVVGNDELAKLARSFNRMADSLQRGEERQRRLVADVAHELRTPLANLRGYLEALKDGVIIPDPELFASLHEEAVLQQRIVDDLQDLAQAEAGVLAYHRTRVDLAELLETCRTAHHARAETARVRLALDAPAPVYANADPDRLRQVLGNLVTNALRATPAGGQVTLRVAGDLDCTTMQVIDTGSGISAKDLPQIFDRFWRADAARGRTTGGSGLGLAITKQIVTDHHGSIMVTSTVGVGTMFTITLPSAL
jgi:two-component system sensor histidine kinase BaeS